MNHLDLDNIIPKLSLKQKIDLLSGSDFWHTASVPSLGIPSIRCSDGPNGVRGPRFFNSQPAACLPCGIALGATWDVNLMRTAGNLLGEEAKAKGAHVVLGPTINTLRSVLAGRGFESFSEDPVLSGLLASQIVQGIQSKGVAAAVKHFVCNDFEHERVGINVLVTERALREIYLKAFEIVQRQAQPKAFMASYNRVNGTPVSESKRFLTDILRNEWGFDGLVMSDWTGTYSAVESIKAGLDLEMPGPTKVRGEQVVVGLRTRKLNITDIDKCIRNVLRLVDHGIQSGIPERVAENFIDTPETRTALRKLARASIVLLKNEERMLPFQGDTKTAVIGSHAKFAAYSGGGSASLRASYTATPLNAIQEYCKDVRYAFGAAANKQLPQMGNMMRTTDNLPGFTLKIFTQPPSVRDRSVIDQYHLDDTYVLLLDYEHELIKNHLFYAELEGILRPDEGGEWDFGLTVRGTAQLFIDGELVVDNLSKQTAGGTFFGSGTVEEIGSINLEPGKDYHVSVRFGSAPTSSYTLPSGAPPIGAGGFRLGGARRVDPEEEIERAVHVARDVDQVILCVGLNGDFESEGFDREHMRLPDHCDKLITTVAKANPNTAVVIQSGMPVAMPWIEDVRAVVQAWYGGNECGNAIADVLFGSYNPSGKLPVSFPVRYEDSPTCLSSRSDNGRALYGEDIFVGYRFYEKVSRKLLFPFGYGLSYTTFDMNDLKVSVDEAHDLLVLEFQLSNTGSVDGEEVVQIYISQQHPTVTRPVKELKAFTKVMIKAAESERVEVQTSLKDAIAFWDEELDTWAAQSDTYTVHVGNSSVNVLLKADFVVQRTQSFR